MASKSTTTVITLPSNSSMNYYPNNTASNYRIKFSTPLNFTDGDYEVGLTGLAYRNSWFNFSPRDHYWFAYKPRRGEVGSAADRNDIRAEAIDGDSRAEEDYVLNPRDDSEEDFNPSPTNPAFSGRMRVNVPFGQYQTPQQLIEALTEHDIVKASLVFSYYGVTQKIYVSSFHNLRVRLGYHLAYKLGWTDETRVFSLNAGERVEAPNVLNLNTFNHLYVHCSLAADSHIVGHQMRPLLKAVAAEGEHGENVSYEPYIVDYLPLRQGIFESCEVLISDESGRPVPFESGQCMIRVHVRRVRPF